MIEYMFALLAAFAAGYLAMGYVINFRLCRDQDRQFKQAEEAMGSSDSPRWDLVPEGFNHYCVSKSGSRKFTQGAPTYHARHEYGVFSFVRERRAGRPFYPLKNRQPVTRPVTYERYRPFVPENQRSTL